MRERKPIDEQTHLAAVKRLARTPLPADLRARVGGKVGRNLYFHSAELGEDGVDVGRVDTTALAEMIVAAVNIYTDASSDQRRCPAINRHHGQCDLYRGHHQPDDPTSRHLTGAVRWADPARQAFEEPLTSFAGSVFAGSAHDLAVETDDDLRARLVAADAEIDRLRKSLRFAFGQWESVTNAADYWQKAATNAEGSSRWWRRRRTRRLRDAEAEIRRLRTQLRHYMDRDNTPGDHGG